MRDPTTIKEIKHLDPIWKRLRIDRIWKLLLLAIVAIWLIQFFVGQQGWKSGGFGQFAFLFIVVFGYIAPIINQFRYERYWLRIGQRRLEALSNPETFRASSQPSSDVSALPLPVTLRLRWSRRRVLIAVVAAILVPIVAGIAIGIAVTSPRPLRGDSLLTLIIVLGVVLACLLILAVLAYFLFLRYQPQSIELTDEGIKTRYMGQERSLSWQEARLFAAYNAQGTSKSPLPSARTFELSNEQVVVRWSQRWSMSMWNLLLVLESNVEGKEDWNWQIGRVNAVVAARTSLPLLDLSDPFPRRLSARQPVQQAIPALELSNDVTPQAPVHIAQDDPFVQHTSGRTQVLTFSIIGVLGLIAILLGVLVKLPGLGSTGHILDFLGSNPAPSFSQPNRK